MSGPGGLPGESSGSAAALLDQSRAYFTRAEKVFDLFGLNRAAENLRRYRSGAGGTEVYPDAEIAKHTPVMQAEDENRTRFQTQTFTGRTNNPELNAAILGLQDGGTHTFPDYWERKTIYGDAPTYLAFGRNAVKSSGNFTARREGNRLSINGSVTHGFTQPERFDFNPGQPGSGAAQQLENAGEAKPFDMQFDRRQSVQAEGRYNPDGSISMDNVTWGKVE